MSSMMKTRCCAQTSTSFSRTANDMVAPVGLWWSGTVYSSLGCLPCCREPLQRLLHPIGEGLVLAQVDLDHLAQVAANRPQRAGEVRPLDDDDVAGVEEGVAHRVDAAGAAVGQQEVLVTELDALNAPLPVGQHLPQVLEPEDAPVAQRRLGRRLKHAVDRRLQPRNRQRVRVRDAAAQVDGRRVFRGREGDGPALCPCLRRAYGRQHGSGR